MNQKADFIRYEMNERMDLIPYNGWPYSLGIMAVWPCGVDLLLAIRSGRLPTNTIKAQMRTLSRLPARIFETCSILEQAFSLESAVYWTIRSRGD